MRLYKFRSLADDNAFDYAKQILKEARFWCASFSDLNDPKEGAFTIFPNNNVLDSGIIDALYSQKSKYRICSFSAGPAFNKPIMWGYYAGGFKGIAIEIKVGRNKVYKISYNSSILHISDNIDDDKRIINILTTKLSPWKHEAEYRFLKKIEFGNPDGLKEKIGTITAVYFGDPYAGADNKDLIYSKSKILLKFKERKDELIKIARVNNIKCYSVKIIDNKVVKDKSLIDISSHGIELETRNNGK